MAEQIKFQYDSIGSIVHMLIDLLYEKSHTSREITVYHRRFDDESPNFYENVLNVCFPDGCNLDEPQLIQVMNHICHLMDTDDKTKDLFNAYDMMMNDSWVYFIPEKRFIRADFGTHAEIIKDICIDVFHDVEGLTVDYLKTFIRKYFEIRSDNSTIEQISNDASKIFELIELCHVSKQSSV